MHIPDKMQQKDAPKANDCKSCFTGAGIMFERILFLYKNRKNSQLQNKNFAADYCGIKK